jgi:hypothetical protein
MHELNRLGGVVVCVKAIATAKPAQSLHGGEWRVSHHAPLPANAMRRFLISRIHESMSQRINPALHHDAG